jgi:cytochrome c peroxidase
LFTEAFGDPEITVDRVARALAQFLRSLQSTRSRYDAGLEDGFSHFTAQELEGKSLFFNSETRCSQCHGTLNFYTPSELMVNGLDIDYAAAGDGGFGDLTGNVAQDGLFRVVSLRNVGMTAPYMHDGRFETLREVIDFYADGIQPHPQLNHRLSESGIGADGQIPMTMPLDPSQREALVAFLHTLSDTTDYATSPWGSPFR